MCIRDSLVGVCDGAPAVLCLPAPVAAGASSVSATAGASAEPWAVVGEVVVPVSVMLAVGMAGLFLLPVAALVAVPPVLRVVMVAARALATRLATIHATTPATVCALVWAATGSAMGLEAASAVVMPAASRPGPVGPPALLVPGEARGCLLRSPRRSSRRRRRCRPPMCLRPG